MKLIFFRCDITISSIYQMYQWEEILINDVKEPQCTCSKQNVSYMLVFEMRKLCLWPSKQTLTKKNQKKTQRRFLRNLLNIRMTNKSMRVDDTYVNPDQYFQFSQLLQSLPELLHVRVLFLYLNAEKTMKAQNSRLGLCAGLLN